MTLGTAETPYLLQDVLPQLYQPTSPLAGHFRRAPMLHRDSFADINLSSCRPADPTAVLCHSLLMAAIDFTRLCFGLLP